MITIDAARCRKDAACARACPMGLLRMKDGDGLPEPIPGAERFCIACGHCVAVCPHGALDHATVPLKESPAISKDLAIGADQAFQFLRSRRSVRQYQDKPVGREDIEKLIALAACAPTASNRQEVRWIVHEGKDKIRELARMTVEWMRETIRKTPAAEVPPFLPKVVAGWDEGRDGVLRHAPALVTAYAGQEFGNGLVDLSIALSYFELGASALGLGTCWAGMLLRAIKHHPPIREAMGLPAGEPHCYPMMLGYPKLAYHRLPARKPADIRWL